MDTTNNKTSKNKDMITMRGIFFKIYFFFFFLNYNYNIRILSTNLHVGVHCLVGDLLTQLVGLGHVDSGLSHKGSGSTKGEGKYTTLEKG